MSRCMVLLVSVLVACSEPEPSNDDGIAEVGSGGGGGNSPVGSECMVDDDCVTMVCWDFNDYDSYCGGTVCSDTCETDADCVALAEAASAMQPEDAQCGMDGRCDLVGTGVGSFTCA